MRGALSLPECPLRCSCTPTQWVLTAAVCPDFVRADGGRVPSAVLKMIQNGADPNGNYLGVSPLSMAVEGLDVDMAPTFSLLSPPPPPSLHAARCPPPSLPTDSAPTNTRHPRCPTHAVPRLPLALAYSTPSPAQPSPRPPVRQVALLIEWKADPLMTHRMQAPSALDLAEKLAKDGSATQQAPR